MKKKQESIHIQNLVHLQVESRNINKKKHYTVVCMVFLHYLNVYTPAVSIDFYIANATDVL